MKNTSLNLDSIINADNNIDSDKILDNTILEMSPILEGDNNSSILKNSNTNSTNDILDGFKIKVTEGDGNCLIHAFLLAVSSIYRNSINSSNHTIICANFRETIIRYCLNHKMDFFTYEEDTDTYYDTNNEN